VGAEHDDRSRAQPDRHELQQLQRREIGRVQVIERDRQRTLARSGGEQPRDRVEQPESAGRWVAARRCASSGTSSAIAPRSGVASSASSVALAITSRRTSTHGQNGGAPPASHALPHATRHPAASAAAA
jgi:hypothetical protein